MIEAQSTRRLEETVLNAIRSQRDELNQLREMVRPLRSNSERIKPRATTSISIVGADGGNKQIEFDPFMLHVVRVVDSTETDYCLEVVSPTSDLQQVAARHFDASGAPTTPLGRMMRLLNAPTLPELSKMIAEPPAPPKPSWIQVYRELHEWAVLLDLVRENAYATDTLVMRDGWLRTKVFADEHFVNYRRLLNQAIDEHIRSRRKRVYVAAVLKRSKVLQKFQLAMMLEGVLRQSYPCFVRVPIGLQERVFANVEIIGGEGLPHRADAENMVAGEMFFVKFGGRPHDPVWAVDLLDSQVEQASAVFGVMLADSQAGFPVPFFPMSLQRAHEHAAISGFDADMIQHFVGNAVRDILGAESHMIDEFELTEYSKSDTGV